MPIDFHDSANRHSYSGREADVSWTAAVTELVEPAGTAVVDVGCGGGTYTPGLAPARRRDRRRLQRADARHGS
jgi:hypothetical protein